MPQLMYVLQFTGIGTPGEDGTLHAATSARSSQISTEVSSTGLRGTLNSTGTERATFTSAVRMTGDTSFDETGTITFGAGHSVDFSTVGKGYMSPSPEDGLMHGVVSWRVENGQGQFVGASGLMTSNFTLSAAGQVTDTHVGVLWLS